MNGHGRLLRFLLRVLPLFPLLMLFAAPAQGQIHDPVKWSFEKRRVAEDSYQLVFRARVQEGWYIYSQNMEPGGPVPTEFTFETPNGYALTGKPAECSKVIEAPEPVFDNMMVRKFKGEALWIKDVDLKDGRAKVEGNVYFMTCDDQTCLPPTEVEFEFVLTGNENIVLPLECEGTQKATKPEKPKKSTGQTDVQTSKPQGWTVNPPAGDDEAGDLDEPEKPAAAEELVDTAGAPDVAVIDATPEPEEERSMWGIFVAGFLGGLLALLTPCVFPMIPLTVSFFTKQSGGRVKGIFNAMMYGAAIIVLYVLLGFIITRIFGPSSLNEMASSIFFNLLFFIVFVIFAISFFGAFDITLPSKWVNAMDAKSDKGGLIGIFFMAFTLALVSFSCTGPIIGTLLVEAAIQGGVQGPLVGMFGFSLALALPFTVFAIFPSWLTSLPKSGGWLNSVKVVLGFVELALALKFLSNVDLAYHWGFLKREIFLALWIVISTLLGFYLLGKIRLPHDSPLNNISVGRLLMAILAFSFSFYMLPGLFGAPLSLLSGLQPPLNYTVWENGSPVDPPTVVVQGGTGVNAITQAEGVEECVHNIPCFKDYEEGLAYAEEAGKPILIDFTGHTCVNCRKMEENVWIESEVQERLKNDYVLISLYVDDRRELPEEEQFRTESGKLINTIGEKWSHFQTEKFKANSQPYYVLLDHNGELLAKPRGYDPDVEEYILFLDQGVEVFAHRQELASKVLVENQ